MSVQTPFGGETIHCEISIRRNGSLGGTCFVQYVEFHLPIPPHQEEFPASGSLAVNTACQVTGTVVVDARGADDGPLLSFQVSAVAWGAVTRRPVAVTGLAVMPVPGLTRPATARLVGHRLP